MEKRFVDTYEVLQSLSLGTNEVIFAEDISKEFPYLVCYCSYDNPLNVEHFFEAIAGDDYVEMMVEYLDRAKKQLEIIKSERKSIDMPYSVVKADDCLPNDYKESIVGKVVAIKPSALKPEYRYAEKQIVLVVGGFGAEANARGRAVYTKNVYTGKESRWNREDILGEMKNLPEWAKLKLNELSPEKQTKKKIKER